MLTQFLSPADWIVSTLLKGTVNDGEGIRIRKSIWDGEGTLLKNDGEGTLLKNDGEGIRILGILKAIEFLALY